MNGLAAFAHHLHLPDISPEELALDIAQLARPDLTPAASLAAIDQLAALAEQHGVGEPAGRAAAEHFLAVFGHELGFTGVRTDYYAPENSLLDEVLARRTGLPIMLCVVCTAIGRRLGLDITGLGFPQHFMARFRDAQGEWLLDPFHRAVVDVAEAATYLAGVIGKPLHLTPAMFAPVTPPEIAARILNNLRAAYLSHPDGAKLLQVFAYQTVLAPQHAPLWRERAVLHYHMQAWEEAAHDLRRYFSLLGALPYLFPEQARAPYDLPALDADDRNLLVMHRRIGELLNRLN